MPDNIWVVIPVFNEAEALGPVVHHVREAYPHVVCIDDGSSDHSAEVALAAGAHVVTHPINLGQGASLQTGFEYALRDPHMRAVITFDADGQHQLEDAQGMLRLLLEKELDVVIGSRFLDGRTTVSASKRLVLKAAAKWGAMSTGMDLTDAHNGLRVISRDTVAKLNIQHNRMAHASEIIDQLSAMKASYAEYPTHIVYTDYSKSKGQPLINSVNILVDLLLK